MYQPRKVCRVNTLYMFNQRPTTNHIHTSLRCLVDFFLWHQLAGKICDLVAFPVISVCNIEIQKPDCDLRAGRFIMVHMVSRI